MLLLIGKTDKLFSIILITLFHRGILCCNIKKLCAKLFNWKTYTR